MRKDILFSTALSLSLASASSLAVHGNGASAVVPVPDSMFFEPAHDADGIGGSYGPGVVLGAADVPARGAAARGDSMVSLDKDGDGRVSRSEAEPAPYILSQFSLLDKDLDGYLSANEFAALGAPSTGGTVGGMSSLDKNNDGLISRSEADADRDISTRFSQLDKNGDGYLDSKEYGAVGAPSAGGMVSDLDKDKDGFISRKEAQDDPDLSSRFSQLDRNADGFLGPTEYSAVGAPAAGGKVSDLDKNNDNYVSRKEADADPGLKDRFSELDKDRDGYLSASELVVYGAPGGGAVIGEGVGEPPPSMNFPPPSDTAGRGDSYSDVESRYRQFPDIRSAY